MPHALDAQVAEPWAGTAQEVPHVPQWSGSVLSVVSQPFAAVASQSPNPELHANPQALEAHVAAAFVRVGQTVLHPPQYEGLLVVSTHIIEQRVGVALPQPDAHAYAPPVPIEHNGVGSLQLVPQLPQCAVVVRSASHPFAAIPSQSPKPAAQ